MKRLKALRAFLFLAICAFASNSAQADNTCEKFIAKSLQAVMSGHLERAPHARSRSLTRIIEESVRINRLAKFTLGKHASASSEDDFERFQSILQVHVVKLLEQALADSNFLEAEILGSIDRPRSECLIESLIHTRSSDKIVLIWRVQREGVDYWIQDIAIRDSGNTIWLSLELRAQFSALLDQNDGSIDALIQSLLNDDQDLR